MEFAGGNLFIALVITMIAAIILGTALPDHARRTSCWPRS